MDLCPQENGSCKINNKEVEISQNSFLALKC